MVTKREAAIISAFTGYLLGDFEEYHKYIESKMERPVQTIEIANEDFFKEIQKRALEDFKNIKVADNHGMGIKLKEISFMIDSEIDLFHKGEYVGKCHETPSTHWIFECYIYQMKIGDYIVSIDTV